MTTLAGRHIVVTRPRAQAEALVARLAVLGATPLRFPLLEIAPLADNRALEAAIAALDSYQLALFISPNAVAYSVPQVLAARAWPSGLLAGAVGSGTQAALQALGLTALAPSERFDSEALLELPALQNVAGQRVVIFRGDGGRELLGDTLRARGATVDAVACYRRLPPAQPATVLLEHWRAGRLDAITLSSSEGLRYLHDLLDAEGRAHLAATPLFVPHARIGETATALGCRRVILTGPADDGLLAGLSAYNWTPSATVGPI